MARRADPGCADDVEAEVPLLADGRLAGVQAHPHPHDRAVGPLVRFERALGCDGGTNGTGGRYLLVDRVRAGLEPATSGEKPC